MLAKQRQARILAEIQEHGWARVTDLTVLLGVSDMTVRRDLDQLAAAGSVHKVHGGAVLNSSTAAEEPGFEAKSVLELPAKNAIAAARGGADPARARPSRSRPARPPGAWPTTSATSPGSPSSPTPHGSPT